jgi:flagellar hook-basal body complex protein FliE
MAGLVNKIGLAEPTGVNSIDSNKNVQNGLGTTFADVLKNTVDETNKIQVEKDKALADLATGQVKDLHQAALAINKADTSMKLMLEVKNKAMSAYKEILRTQI